MSRVSRCRVQTTDFYIVSDLNTAKIVSANTQSYVIEIQYRIYKTYNLDNNLNITIYTYLHLNYEYKHFYEINRSQRRPISITIASKLSRSEARFFIRLR